MTNLLNETLKADLIQRGFSRRSFGRIAAMIAAGAAMSYRNEPAMAQLSAIKGPMPADAVKIDANENPMGPCAEAIAAMTAILPQGGRYSYDLTNTFVETLATQEGLQPTYVKAYPGSSAPLQHAVLAFTGPDKPYIVADPGYEQGEGAAKGIGSKSIRVPLTKTFAHDVKAMAAASPTAGLIYLCNPNNPTGTLTPREDIEWLVDNMPKGCVLLLDEAYIHIAGAQRGSDFVAKDKNVIVLRTFSKIYGMAGIRAAAAFGKPELLAKMANFNAGALPITAMVAATASLKAKDLVEDRRKVIADIRTDCLAFLEKNKFTYVPSVSNKFMVDVKRPAMEVITALRDLKVYVGRVWPVWPTHIRVTVGTQDEMNKFKSAFLKVMA